MSGEGLYTVRAVLQDWITLLIIMVMVSIVYRQMVAFRLTLLFSLLLVVSVGNARWVHAQSGAAAKSSPPAEESAARNDLRFTLESSGKHGSYTYLPEQWGEFQLRFENLSESARDVLCTSYFVGQPSLQYGRQVWVPPGARISVSHPVLFPKENQLPDRVARMHTLAIDRSQGNEVLFRGDSGQFREERSLPIAPMNRNTGVVTGWALEDLVSPDVIDLLVASRIQQGLNNRVTVLGGQFLPADETNLKYLDHLVIEEDRLLNDHAALTAVRRWVHAGGRLWIMLDRVDPLILERLFGDDFHGTLVDRVGLSAVRIDEARTAVAPEGKAGETIEYENPVVLARVLIPGMKVWNTVDGWPVALSQSYGAGRVLVTTLGPRGWIKPKVEPVATRNNPPPPPADPALGKTSKFVPVSAMEDIAGYILAVRGSELLSSGMVESIAQEYVSYKVPGWSLMATLIGSFLALLFAVGLIFWKWNRLEHFGWIGTCLSVCFGIGLTLFGFMNRYGIPATMSSVQLASAIHGTDDVRTQGVIAVYHPEGSPATIQASHGGTLWSPRPENEEVNRRIVTTDLGVYHWEGQSQPTGLGIYTEEASRSLPEQLAAVATVDANGLAGNIAGKVPVSADALLATRFGRIKVRIGADGTLTASPDDVLDLNQFMEATFVDDEQSRRQRMLQHLFGNPGWNNYLDHPQVLLWSNKWESGFQFGENIKPEGVTLLAVPLELYRPAPGSQLVIPSPLLGFSMRHSPEGKLSTGFWDDIRGEWHERSGPSSMWLGFQVPRDLLPLKATKARLKLKVTGPMERFEILGIKNGATVSLHAVDDPAGSFTIELDDADALAISEQGELPLGLNIGRAVPAAEGLGNDNAAANVALGSTRNYWKIESLALQLWATAEESTEGN